MITIKEFCQRNSMSRSTCTRLQNLGMPTIKIKMRVWIVEDEAIEWMKQYSEKLKDEKK